MVAVEDRGTVCRLDVCGDLAAEAQGFKSVADGCSCTGTGTGTDVSVLGLLLGLLLFLVDGFEALADAFEMFEFFGAVFC